MHLQGFPFEKFSAVCLQFTSFFPNKLHFEGLVEKCCLHMDSRSLANAKFSRNNKEKPFLGFCAATKMK